MWRIFQLVRYGIFRTLSKSHCRRCGVNTSKIHEYYVLHDEIWDGVVTRWKLPLDRYGESGMMCVGCFEQLLGRRLTKGDFLDCPVNEPLGAWPKSVRLYQRLTADIS
jgi:hypothetical protein